MDFKQQGNNIAVNPSVKSSIEFCWIDLKRLSILTSVTVTTMLGWGRTGPVQITDQIITLCILSDFLTTSNCMSSAISAPWSPWKLASYESGLLNESGPRKNYWNYSHEIWPCIWPWSLYQKWWSATFSRLQNGVSHLKLGGLHFKMLFIVQANSAGVSCE